MLYIATLWNPELPRPRPNRPRMAILPAEKSLFSFFQCGRGVFGKLANTPRYLLGRKAKKGQAAPSFPPRVNSILEAAACPPASNSVDEMDLLYEARLPPS